MQWHRDRRRMTPGEASTQVRTATELQRLPKTAAKVASGEISTDQAAAAVRTADGLPTTNRDDLDALVAEQAPDSNVSQLRKQDGERVLSRGRARDAG